jgi:hypothetical protein
MREEQDKLQAAADELVAELELMGADYRFAAIAGSYGRTPGFPYSCPPHPPFIDDAYPDRRAALTCALRLGYSSEVLRDAFGAAILGLHRAIDPDSEPNPLATFLRPEAELALVFVSDEDDHSLASPAALRDFLFSVKGSYRPDRVQAHAIAGDPNLPCTIDPWLTPGHRYVEIAGNTSGTFTHVCTDDFAPVLTDLARTIFSPRDRFDLSRPADPATIQVLVDGTPIPLDPNDGFSFDAQANTISLQGASKPSPGATITVRYGDGCP